MTSSAYQRAFQALLTALAYGSISPKDPPVPWEDVAVGLLRTVGLATLLPVTRESGLAEGLVTEAESALQPRQGLCRRRFGFGYNYRS